MCVENDYIWNPATCSCENGKYLGIIINDSVITRYEIIFYFFLFITIASLIADSICCYLIKFQANLKHLLSYQVTNNKF